MGELLAIDLIYVGAVVSLALLFWFSGSAVGRLIDGVALIFRAGWRGVLGQPLLHRSAYRSQFRRDLRKRFATIEEERQRERARVEREARQHAERERRKREDWERSEQERRRRESAEGAERARRAQIPQEPLSDAYAQAAKLLKLPEHLTRQALNRAYRRAMLAAHPDKGGTKEQAQAINAARDLVRRRHGWASGHASRR